MGADNRNLTITPPHVDTVIMVILICLFLFDFAFGADPTGQILNLYKQTLSGQATYYGSEGWGQQGQCSYAPPDMPEVAKSSLIDDWAALGDTEWFDSMTCGMCVRVSGSGVGH